MKYLKYYLESKFANIDYNSDYYLNKKSATINGIQYEFGQVNDIERDFIIELNGNEIGRASLNKDGYLNNVRILPEYRRIGLGTYLYDYIESVIDKKLIESPIKQSIEAKKLWDKRNKKDGF